MSTVDEFPADGAALLRRTVRRTLIVLGGSVAGTAVAVAISSASASADSGCPATQPAAPGLAEPSDAGQLLEVRLTQPVCAVQRIVPPGITDLGAGPARVTDDLGGDLADDLDAGLAGRIGLAPRVLIDLDGIGVLDGGESGDAETGVVPAVGRPQPAALAPPADERAAAPTTRIPEPMGAPAGLISHGSPAPGSPAPLVLPHRMPLPVAQPAVPAGGPASGGSGCSGGDSPVFAVPAGAGHSGLVRVPALPAAEPRLVAVPGRAPGTTPD
jgi:hypothetical protein